MHSHGKSLVKIYEDIGMEVFPSEYLPDDYNGPSAGTRAEIIGKIFIHHIFIKSFLVRH